MKKFRLLGLTVALGLVAVLVMAQSTPPRYSAVSNVAYFNNPVTHQLALYLSFELEPGHVYRFETTHDGINFKPAFEVNTTGNLVDVYESFNIDPCLGPWPRVLDLGPTQ